MVWAEVLEVTLTCGKADPVDDGGSEAQALPTAPWEARSAMYAWGYAPPAPLVVESLLEIGGYGKPVRVRHQSRWAASEDARQFARERGWDETRGGAWAAGITLPLDLPAAEALLIPALRRDPAVAGWADQALGVESMEETLGAGIAADSLPRWGSDPAPSGFRKEA